MELCCAVLSCVSADHHELDSLFVKKKTEERKQTRRYRMMFDLS